MNYYTIYVVLIKYLLQENDVLCLYKIDKEMRKNQN